MEVTSKLIVLTSALALSVAGACTSDEKPGKGGDHPDASSPSDTWDSGKDPGQADADAGAKPDASSIGEPDTDAAAEAKDAALSDARAPTLDATSPTVCADAGDDRTDTDSDGLPDACDDDDDDDGFADADDVAPLDSTRPGDYSTPEKILADPRVKAALEKIRQTTPFPTYTELTPPDISGLYATAPSTIQFVASGNGQNVGSLSPSGSEERNTVHGDLKLDTAGLFYIGAQRYNFSIGKGQLLRGTGNGFSTYERGSTACTSGSSPYLMYYLSISTGTVEPATGNIVERITLFLDLETTGTYSTACNLGGDAEFADGWEAHVGPLARKIGVADIAFMCAGLESAYVPGETWTEADGKSCTCSPAFATSCTGP